MVPHKFRQNLQERVTVTIIVFNTQAASTCSMKRSSTETLGFCLGSVIS
jgi:hypothetical protein